jgi:hypothetical protein
LSSGVSDLLSDRDGASVGRGETCGPTVGFRKEVNHSQLWHVLGATTQVSPLERSQPIATSQHSRFFLYYRKGKNKNTKFEQATLSGNMNNTRKLVTLHGFASLVIVFIFFMSGSDAVLLIRL